MSEHTGWHRHQTQGVVRDEDCRCSHGVRNVPAPSPAGPERETADLAEWLRDERLTACEHSTACFPDCCVTCLRDRILASPWLAAYVAAAVESAKAEGAETALRDAAVQLGHIHQSDSPGVTSVRAWLRARADALRAATEEATS